MVVLVARVVVVESVVSHAASEKERRRTAAPSMTGCADSDRERVTGMGTSTSSLARLRVPDRERFDKGQTTFAPRPRAPAMWGRGRIHIHQPRGVDRSLSAVDIPLRYLFQDRDEGWKWNGREASGVRHPKRKEQDVSHYIDTPQTSYGGSTGLSPRQRWEIVLGIVVAAVLAVAAFAYVNRADSPVVEQAAQPVAESYAATDDLATRSAAPAQSLAGTDDLATRSAVPAQSFAGTDDLATRTVVAAAPSYAGSDDLATRPVAIPSPEVMPLAGSDDVATRPVVVEAQGFAGVDDLATRLTGPRYSGSDDLAAR